MYQVISLAGLIILSTILYTNFNLTGISYNFKSQKQDYLEAEVKKVAHNYHESLQDLKSDLRHLQSLDISIHDIKQQPDNYLRDITVLYQLDDFDTAKNIRVIINEDNRI
jgi:NADH:ubiquinone oxidoreductase subunit C